VPTGARPALLQVTERLAREFDAVPAGAVMRVVLTCWRELSRVADLGAWDRSGASLIALVEDTARMRLRHRHRRAASPRKPDVQIATVGEGGTADNE